MNKVKIKGEEIALRYTIKGLILFEAIKNNNPNVGSLFDVVAIIWSFLRAEIDRSGVGVDLTLDEFVDWCDENQSDYVRCVKWLNKEQARQSELLDDSEKKRD